MRTAHFISAVVILLFALFICCESARLSFGTLKSPGPALVPFGSGALLFLLALILAAKQAAKATKLKSPTAALWHGVQWKRVALTLLILFAYAFFLEHLGYVFSTWVLMASLFWGKGLQKQIVATLAALGVSATSYLVFKLLLNVQLPAGMLGI